MTVVALVLDVAMLAFHTVGLEPSRATRIQSGGVKEEGSGVKSVVLVPVFLGSSSALFQRAGVMKRPFLEVPVVEALEARLRVATGWLESPGGG